MTLRLATAVLLLAASAGGFAWTATTRPRVAVRLAAVRQREPQPNLYDVLGASPRDDQATLKRRYIAQARRLHPDVNPQATTADFQAVARVSPRLFGGRGRALIPSSG